MVLDQTAYDTRRFFPFQCWLSLVKGSDSTEEDVDPLLQARFSQAVAELQFMGFIKASKRKTDHVARLTWGAAS